MKKVITFGTFDIFHPGHASYLKQAKKLGDYLIAVIGRDRTVENIKGKRPRNDEKIRLQEVRKSGLADKVILGSLKDKFSAIKKYKPDIVALGYDQISFSENLEKKLKEFKIKTRVIRLKSFKPQIYKSSKLTGGIKDDRIAH